MFDEKFWLAISFTLFASLLIKYIWPKISKALDQKSKAIAEEILAAKELRAKSAELLAAAEKYYQESVTYSQKLIADAEAEAQKFLADAEKSIADELEKKTTAANERIKREEEKTLRQIRVEIVAAALKTIAVGAAKSDKKQSSYLFTKAAQDFSKIIH